jgi:hypothetical protein
MEEVTLAAQCPSLQLTSRTIGSIGTLFASFNLDPPRSSHTNRIE